MRLRKSGTKELNDAAKAQEYLQKINDDKLEEIKLDFIRRTDLKSYYSRLNHEVNLAMKTYDNDFEKKRNQLRAKLLEDESCLNFEYVDKAQKYAERLFQAKKLRAEAITEAHRKDHIDHVDDMLTRQKMLNCDELRSKTTKDKRIIASKANQVQMIEKKLLKEKEKDLDYMYHNLIVTDCKYDFENAELREKIRERAEIDECLKLQMAGREYAQAELDALVEEEKEVRKKFNENLAEGDRLKVERDEIAKKNLNIVLLGQRKCHEEVQEERHAYEKEINKIILDALLKEAADNVQTDIEDKIKAAQDYEMYKQAWDELNGYKKNLDELDVMTINNMNNQKLEDTKQFHKKIASDKRRWARDAVSCLDKQMKLKEDRKKMIKDIGEAERKLYETCNTEVDKARNRQKKDELIKLQNDVYEHMKYNEVVRRREEDVRRKLERDVLKGREENLVELEQKSNNIQTIKHPFFRTLTRR